MALHAVQVLAERDTDLVVDQARRPAGLRCQLVEHRARQKMVVDVDDALALEHTVLRRVGWRSTEY